MPRRTPTYAPVISYLRSHYQMSRHELATQLGVPDYYVGYMEDGYRYPRPRHIQGLSRIFQWAPFELALLADVDIPYPDWPRLDDIGGWYRLANQWNLIVETIQRYSVAKVLWQEESWRQSVIAQSLDLAPEVQSFGFIAFYGGVRQLWQSVQSHPGRTTPPHSLEQALDAITVGREPQYASLHEVAPTWWSQLTPAARATVETVAQSLMKEHVLHSD